MKSGSSTNERLSIARLLMIVSLLTSCIAVGLSRPAIADNTPAETGRAHGRVTDKISGQPLLGVTVALAGTKLGAFTDLDGYFEIKGIPSGSYTLVATSVGYDTATVASIVIKNGETVEFKLRLSSVLVEVPGMTVTGQALKNTEATVLKGRQKADQVQDGISAQEISRSGGGNAAQAMMRVTGASVVDGKYVVVRGLGDRYTNTRLNGAALPSADPDKQTFNMDLVPSDLLDNIVITKSYTADQPGNFTGGSVNLVTKDFPETRAFSITAGSSFNTLFTGKNVLSNTGSSTDWLGTDDGMRDIPQFLKDNYDRLPTHNVIYRKPYRGSADDIAQALFLDSACKAFSPEFNPRSRKAAPNQSYSFSYGDNLSLLGRSLGVIGNLTYDRKSSAYRNGEANLYAPLTATSLDPVNLMKEDRGSDQVLWGGLASLHYSLAANHKIGLRYVYDRDGKAETRFLRGVLNDYGPGEVYESHDVDYTERTLRSGQINGVHELKLGVPLKVEWQYGDSRTVQNQNLRQFAYSVLVDSSVVPPNTVGWGTTSSLLPTVYWRDINERNREFSLDIKMALSKRSSVKFGGSFLDKERTHRQTAIKYMISNTQLLTALRGNMDQWAQHAGLLDTATSGRFYSFDSYIYAWPSLSDQYDGSQKIPAWYVLAQTSLFENLNVMAGVRHERTEMQAQSLEPIPQGGKINKSDWLPSLNLTYSLSSKMNLRGAYSRTLARPNLREIAVFRSLDFAASKYFYGNPNLRYTRITNYDLRWEWFTRPNEVLAVSLFYKRFVDPIEIAYTVENYDRRPVNAPDAKNFGIELEARKQLDQVAGWLADFSVGANLTLVHSAVRIPSGEYSLMRNIDPTAKDTRPMANQSPYIVNISVGYNNARRGTALTLLYNVFGRRFYYNAQGASPDIYEMPRRQFDLTFSQNVFRGVTFKASAKNLLNARFEADYYYTGTGEKITFRRNDYGRSFSIGLNYKVM